jgi:hypothetical protein
VATLTFLPSRDSALVAWSTNFNTLITATPTAFGLTAALATAYGSLHTAFVTAVAACDPGIRSKASVSTKNTAKAALKAEVRLLASLVNGTASVTNAQKLQLGLSVRSKPSPIPAPINAPGLDVISVTAWTVKIKLHDSAAGSKRGKPAGVSGGSIFSFVGATAPNDIASWKFEGNTGKIVNDIAFDTTNAPGTKVWLTAFWFNGRKQSGPACSPVSTNLQGGSVSLAA